MLVLLFPWLVSLFGGVVFWVVAKHPIGWLLGVVQMMLFVPLAILTGEWGFLAQTVIYSGVFIRNYFVELKEHRKPEDQKPRCSKCSKVIRKVAAG